MKKAIYTFLLLFYLSSSLFSQNINKTKDTSFLVVVINEDTLLGSYKDYDLNTFKFKQLEKNIYNGWNEKYPKNINSYNSHIELREYYNLKLEGEFNEGRKVGTWVYWNQEYDPYLKQCQSIYPQKLIKYYKDSIIISEPSFGIYKEITYSLDSSIVRGVFTFDKNYKVILNCENAKDSCFFMSKGEVISAFKAENWQQHLNEIEYRYIRNEHLKE